MQRYNTAKFSPAAPSTGEEGLSKRAAGAKKIEIWGHFKGVSIAIFEEILKILGSRPRKPPPCLREILRKRGGLRVETGLMPSYVSAYMYARIRKIEKIVILPLFLPVK